MSGQIEYRERINARDTPRGHDPTFVPTVKGEQPPPTFQQATPVIPTNLADPVEVKTAAPLQGVVGTGKMIPTREIPILPPSAAAVIETVTADPTLPEPKADDLPSEPLES